MCVDYLSKVEALRPHLLCIHVVQGITNASRVRFEAFTTVNMKNGVFWDVTPCGSCKNRRFGGT
jgi:hypothetical protein